ncbi:MAG TPA: helix-turn-helix transcriptional regulator [Solirubrobacterales bacterium]|nr:helix-turn-helix transcriptional regulator [Solirubrobacterales bacterium]
MSPPPPDQDESLAALGRVVSQVRKEAGLTQEELARRAGLEEADVGRIESGQRNPTWGTVRKISYALDLPLPELIRRVEALEREA